MPISSLIYRLSRTWRRDPWFATRWLKTSATLKSLLTIKVWRGKQFMRRSSDHAYGRSDETRVSFNESNLHRNYRQVWKYHVWMTQIDLRCHWMMKFKVSVEHAPPDHNLSEYRPQDPIGQLTCWSSSPFRRFRSSRNVSVSSVSRMASYSPSRSRSHSRTNTALINF